MGDKFNYIQGKIELVNNEIFKEYVSKFETEEGEKEKVVECVFSKHRELTQENILIKTIVLNNIYNTKLNNNKMSDEKKEDYKNKKKVIPVDVYTMSEHLYKVLSEDFKVNDKKVLVSLVNKIKNVGKDYSKPNSFATKFCSWSYKDDYPKIAIVDSKVKGMLYRYNLKYKYMDKFKREELDDYSMFLEVYESFLKCTNLEKEDYKKVDEFLWEYAKTIEDNAKKDNFEGVMV